LDLFDNCPYRYYLKYILGNYVDESTLSLELGTLAHKAKELASKSIIDGKPIDMKYIEDIINNGFLQQDVTYINDEEVYSTKEEVTGLIEIKKKYLDEYYKKCEKSGLTYNDKWKIFYNNLNVSKHLGEWKILDVEVPFEIKYTNDITIVGKIDRIDINPQGELRITDYKSSASVYKDDKLKTPLQMFIYALACQNIYKKLPISYVYDFVFLGEMQESCSKGYYERGKKKLDSLIDKIIECETKQEFIPKATPLCAWCEFSGQGYYPNNYSGLCEYYSLWTRENKTFAVNRKWGEETKPKVEPKKDFVW
jgi:ATP-dependent helicase/DNAse subunit B